MINRLKLLIDYYGLSSSSFADKIDVPRSSISHLLSGRNRPSLDFVMKVVEAFDEVDLNWLVYGQGTFPSTPTKEEQTIEQEPKLMQVNTDLFSSIEKTVQNPSLKTQIQKSGALSNDKQERSENPVHQSMISTNENTQFSATEKTLVKIVLLYNDGTFEVFKN